MGETPRSGDPASLEWSAEEMTAMGEATLERVVAHLASLGEQPARGDMDVEALCRALREAAPETGEPHRKR